MAHNNLPDACQPITLAVTGASGTRYGLRLLQCLLDTGREVLLMISRAGREVLALEDGLQLPEDVKDIGAALSGRFAAPPDRLRVFGERDWHSPAASGSGAPRQMVVCPCSTGTLSAIACGSSDNLIERAADVVLKERGRLHLVVREMPLSAVHLENMLKLARLGVIIMPASPGFYNRPATVADVVDSVVSRVLDHLGVPQQLMKPWGKAE